MRCEEVVAEGVRQRIAPTLGPTRPRITFDEGTATDFLRRNGRPLNVALHFFILAHSRRISSASNRILTDSKPTIRLAH